MADCETFLAEYSALRDGLVPDGLRVVLEAHRDGCPSCARYDRVIRDGTEVVRRVPELDVSDDFMARLEGRLYEVDLERAVQASHAGAGAATVTLSVAALIAAAAWMPVVSLQAPSAASRAAGERAPATSTAVQMAVSPDTQFESARGATVAGQLMALGVMKTPYSDLLFRNSPLAAPVAVLAGYDGGGLALALPE